jgi:3-hydroxyisobutyrate dehydrogenase
MDHDRLNAADAGDSRVDVSAGVVDERPVVGVVGLGAMGRGIVQNLLLKGYSVVGHDINPQALAWLKDQGAFVARDAEDLALRAETVVSFVVDDRQTDDALFGAFGLAQALRPGALLIVCSTMSPRYVRGLEERLLASGVELLDAPVTGGMVGARQGTLTVMVGGPAARLERARPVLSTFAARIVHLGDRPGAGAQMKVINQLLCGVHIAAAAEALALAQRQGLRLDNTLDVLRSGAASSWMLGDRGPRMVQGAFSEVTSAVDIFVKDLGLVVDAAQAVNAETPLAQAAFHTFRLASARGWGALDDSAVLRVLTGDQ